MVRACALIRAVATADERDADAWCDAVVIPRTSFAGRGIVSKPANDEQIREQLRRGVIEMALWGVSLDPGVADSYGGGFRFEIEGAFPGVPAWLWSGIKAEEREIVTGGRYDVSSVREVGGVTVVSIRHRVRLGRDVGDDPVLLHMLAHVPDVWASWLTRTTDSQTLGLDFGDGVALTVKHARGGSFEFSGSEPDWAVRALSDCVASAGGRALSVARGAQWTGCGPVIMPVVAEGATLEEIIVAAVEQLGFTPERARAYYESAFAMADAECGLT